MPRTRYIDQIRARYIVSNVTPVWLLVFWRLVRGEAGGDFAKAYRLLPDRIPAGTISPSIEECAAILAHYRLA